MILSMPAFGESRDTWKNEFRDSSLDSDQQLSRESLSTEYSGKSIKSSRMQLAALVLDKRQIAEFKSFYQPSAKLSAYGYDLMNTKFSDSDTSYNLKIRAGLARNPRSNGAGVQLLVDW